MNHKFGIGLALFALIFAAAFVNASILATATVEKTSLAPDELARLTVKLYNDSDENMTNVLVQVQADEGIVFVDGQAERANMTKTIEKLGAKEEILIVQGIKAIATKQPRSTIYIYYGTNTPLTSAAATVIGLAELPISVKAESERKTINDADTMIIDFKFTNHSEETYHKASVEVVAPKGFNVQQKPVLKDSLKPEEMMNQTFYISAPIDAKGEQIITLAYGFFDSDGPHYFEKRYAMEFNKPDYGMIILIGIIVLAVAAFMYARKYEATALQGTAEKKK